MNSVQIVEIKEDIKSRNNEQAKDIRREMKEKKIFFLNVMSSPGSGKTTLIINLIQRLKDDFTIGVIEADVDSAVDAERIASETGVKTIQMHTCGACHITCQMSYESLCALGVDGLDVVILENIGNLVCPAEFDTGATKNLVLLSVPEGDDKPLKYPLIYRKCDLVLINKIDAMPYFTFDMDRCVANIKLRNNNSTVIPISAKTGENLDEVVNYFIKIISSGGKNYNA